MRVGYAKTSTTEQKLDLQIDALKKVGCEKFFTDHGISSITVARSSLGEALEYTHKGNALIIWKLV